MILTPAQFEDFTMMIADFLESRGVEATDEVCEVINDYASELIDAVEETK